ncbi:TIGR04104 family putative zinc finger protein [Paenisporosarcina sp. NPDC076898]|uniref:TIGR04104 family putative zinc finger protein n=1 Tax=unclassified Paenisporosarcina TaxID=2642018 RepID=UPI003D079BEA
MINLGIQKCEHCTHRFSWSKLFKNNWLSYKPIQCSLCSTRHQITYFSRVLTSILIIVPMNVYGFHFAREWQVPLNYSVLIIILIGIFISLLFPFIVKYKAVD